MVFKFEHYQFFLKIDKTYRLINIDYTMSLSNDHPPCPELQAYAIKKFQYLISQSDGNCPITFEPIQRPAYTLCGHVFEFDALVAWSKQSPCCPYCNYKNPYALVHYSKPCAEYFIKRLVREYITVFELPYMKATG